MEKKFTCVVCPIGCELSISYDENDMSPEKCTVTGNSCPRGEKYAKSEIIHPERTLTSTVKTNSKVLPMLPVKTSVPIPKDKMFEAMQLLNTITVSVPVKSGDTVYRDFVVQGTNLTACRTIEI